MSEQSNKPDDTAKEVTPWQTWGNGVSTIGPNPLPDGPPVDLDLRPRNPDAVNAIAGRDPDSVQPQRGVTASTPNRPDHTFAPESPAEAPEGDEPAPEPQEEPEEAQGAPESRTRPAPAS